MLNRRFCRRRHDTFLPGGRNKFNKCSRCAYLISKQFSKSKKGKLYRKINREKIINRMRCWYDDHRIELLLKKKEYYIKNKKKIRKRQTPQQRKRKQIDVNFRLSCMLRDRLNKAIKGNYKTGSAVKDLGCSIYFLKQYVENKFYGGMTWDNWGTIWQLDHIISLWKFDLTDREQFLKAVHYTNLQPLSILDHREKTAKEVKSWLKND